MNIVRWEPFREMVTLKSAMDRLLEDSFVRWPKFAEFEEGTVMPAIDIFEDKDKVGIKASMPGVKPEDVEISITNGSVTIKGQTKSEQEIKEENYVRKERHYGTFSRTIALPSGLKIDKAEATMEHGVLTLEIPRADEVKPRTVKIKAKKEPEKIEAKEAKS